MFYANPHDWVIMAVSVVRVVDGSAGVNCLPFSDMNQHIAAFLCVARPALVHAVNQYISIIPGGSLANFL